MAQNYTTAEISAAVTKLVRESIRRTYGSLGTRELGNSFNDTMDAAAGVFLTTPNAPFYVVFLGAQRLREAITTNLAEVQELVDAITAVSRRVKPVENLTSLGNARVALGAMATASSARTSQFASVDDLPSFQRFDTNIERFLQQEGRNVRSGGSIVRTPQQARVELSSLLQSSLSSYQDIIRRAGLLGGAIDDFNSLNLPSTLSQNILSNAQEVLQEDIDALQALSPQARLQVLRQVVLNVLATRSVVRGFASLPSKSTFVILEGAGAPYADLEHPALPATVTSPDGDPFTVLEGLGDEVDFTIDGALSFTLSVPLSFPARLEGTVAENYDIDAGVNDELTITVEGFSDVNVTLTAGGVQSAQAVCDDINAAVGAQPIVAEPFFNPVLFAGAVDTQNASGGSLEFVRLEGDWADVGAEPFTTIIQVQDPTSSMDGLRFSILSFVGPVAATALLDAGTTANETGITAQMGPASRFIRIRISDAGEEDAVDNRRAIGIGESTDEAATTLGLVPGSSIRSRGTRAEDIADFLNSQPSSAPAGVPRLEVDYVFQAFRTFSARSDPNDPLRLLASRYRATGEITTGGFSATFSVVGAASAGVVTGDRVTIRAAAISGNLEAQGVVFAVSDTEVQATMGVSVTAEAGLDLEFAPFAAIGRDLVVRIADPSPNSGDYLSGALSSDTTAVALQRPLPVFSGAGGQPVTFEVEEGQNYPVFRSTSTLVDSAIEATWLPGTISADGTTPFVRLPSNPRTIELGDKLEVYTIDYSSPSLTSTIVGLELSNLLIEVDPPIPVDTVLNFSNSSTLPFARIRKGQFNTHSTIQGLLEAWTTLEANSSGYSAELNRLINPLLSNSNPIISAVNTAKVYAQELSIALNQLDDILASYVADVVPRVDTLIDTMLSRGSDRAVDTLLEGRFSEFFGYNSDEVSYIGNALKQLRDVQRLDLPVRRTGRQERLDTELTLGEAEEPDFEFDQSDVQDAGEDVDIPGQFFSLPGGGSF